MIEVFSYSETGGHAENQDAFVVRPHPPDPNCDLCVVADGQGGRSGAAVATQLACKAAIETATAHTPRDLLRPRVWLDVLDVADQGARRTSTSADVDGIKARNALISGTPAHRKHSAVIPTRSTRSGVGWRQAVGCSSAISVIDAETWIVGLSGRLLDDRHRAAEPAPVLPPPGA